jgi:hypothetical protein
MERTGFESARFRTFVVALFSSTWDYVLYGGGAAMLALWAYITQKTPPISIWLLVGAAGFFLAAYKAWRDERGDLNSTIQKLHHNDPWLTVFPLNFGESKSPHPLSGYHFERFTLEVVNGGADTTLRDWHGNYYIPTPDGSSEISTEVFDRDNPSTANLVNDERIIPTGGRRLGWVQFARADGSPQIVKAQIKFRDHTGRIYSATFPPSL